MEENSTKWLDLNTGILLLLQNRTQEYLLPKGRKDIGETLPEAAVRETYEETGYKCTLKPHKLPTKATNGSLSSKGVAHMEPIACQQRLTARGVRKIIFWYVAVGDSHDVKMDGTLDKGEDFTSLWVEVEKGIALLTFEDDQRIVRLALQALRGALEMAEQ